jgi:CBS domain-containing protein
MNGDIREIEAFLATRHPYDCLPASEIARTAKAMQITECAAGEDVYSAGEPLKGLYLIAEGKIEVRDPAGSLVSVLGRGNTFGERGLMREGRAVTRATADGPVQLLLLPLAEFQRLLASQPAFERFFDRTRPAEAQRENLLTVHISQLMTPNPVTCAPEATITEAARLMRENRVSCALVTEGARLIGIVTNRDLANRALAEGLSGDVPVAQIMTREPTFLSPDALGIDVLHEMLEHGIGHMPVVDRGRLVGILTQTNLTRYQATSSAHLIGEVAGCQDVAGLAGAAARIPQLLVQLVAAGNRHDVITRLITDIGDATTRRLIVLGEQKLGPPPVPYLWLACGSQGRQEQTGVSDQDNCLFLDDAAKPGDDDYFAALAQFVSEGLNACGYYYCPGDMMATSPRWRQPVRVWRDYFAGWIRKPDPMAQMLASVMFDLRPISGDLALFEDVQADTLKKASENSIFVAHMIANSLKHTPPLSLFRGFATIRSGEHKDTLDLKLNGVIPVVDLGRVYALQGRIEASNTRARLLAAEAAGLISTSGAHDLRDAYDLIAETRLRNQADQVRAGAKPDNFMAPSQLSELERSHLRDAFVVVKTMQSVLGQSRSMPG